MNEFLLLSYILAALIGIILLLIALPNFLQPQKGRPSARRSSST